MVTTAGFPNAGVPRSEILPVKYKPSVVPNNATLLGLLEAQTVLFVWGWKFGHERECRPPYLQAGTRY